MKDLHLPMLKTLRINLSDTGTGQGEQPLKLTATPLGINVQAQGYGDKTSAEGHGSPIWIELHDGDLRLIVWSDINKEDPTHIISLAGAREDRRLPDHEETFP